MKTVYLDHNVLDALTKQRAPCVRWLFSLEPEYIPVFSSENLNEIERSKGYEATFLDLLSEMGARYLRPHINSDFMYTGEATIEPVDPVVQFATYRENKLSSPPMGYGITGMLQKFYGGLPGQEIDDVLSTGVDEFSALLDSVLSGLKGEELPADLDLEALHRQLELGKDAFRGAMAEISGRLAEDTSSSSPVRKVEATLRGGPAKLQNINGPNILQKLWERIRPGMPPNSLTMEQFFGIAPVPGVTPSKWNFSIIEKVNAIYHQLNFVGYYRDLAMHKTQRFGAHFSDMTHAGLASFCDRFLCMDADLAKKAEAAYEYLGVRTEIACLPIKPNK